MKEKEESEQEETSSYSSSASTSSIDDDFSGGFWSWGSWLSGLMYALGFTFSIGGVLAALITPYLLIPAPAFMILWAILLIIHGTKKR